MVLCLVAIATLKAAGPTITLNLPAASFPEVVGGIRNQHVLMHTPRFGVDGNLCVLVKDQPVRAVLHAVAELEDLEVEELGPNEFEFRPSLEKRRKLSDLISAERVAARDQAVARLNALAAAAKAADDEPDPAVTERKDEADLDAKKWSEWRVRQAPYRLLGLVWPHLSGAWHSYFLRGDDTHMPFTMTPAPVRGMETYDGYLNWTPEERDLKFAGYSATFSFSSETGHISAYPYVKVPTKIETAYFDLRRSPLSEKQLSQLDYIKGLGDWKQPLQAPASWPADYTHELPSPSHGSERTTTEELIAAHHATGISIVADASRFAEFAKPSESPAKLEKWLEDFRDQQEGYAKVVDGMLVFRNRAFWRARPCELPEALVSWLEQIFNKKQAGLDEYATFASALAHLERGTSTNLPFQLFTDDAYQIKFDPEPIVKLGPALAEYGALEPGRRRYLLQPGNWVYLVSGTSLPVGSGWLSEICDSAPAYGAPTDDEMLFMTHHASMLLPASVMPDWLDQIAQHSNGRGVAGYRQIEEGDFLELRGSPVIDTITSDRTVIRGPITLWFGLPDRRYAAYSYTFKAPDE